MGRVLGRIARAFGRTESSQRRKSSRFAAGAVITGLVAGTLVTGSQLGIAAPLDSTIQKGQGFELNEGDLRFILKQIKIAEAHAAVNYNANDGETLVGRALFSTTPDKWQIGNPLLPYGLRTVDGTYNNLVPGQEYFGATGHILTRHVPAAPRTAEAPWVTGGPAGTLGGPDNNGNTPVLTSYEQKLDGNIVIDSQPRTISNLIVDQTPSNPAAVAAAAKPIRTSFNDPTAWPCATLATASPEVQAMFEDPSLVPDTALADCTPNGESLDIPNVTTDFGLSPPYNSWFTFFGQFFDHGLDLTAKAGGTVYVPLKADDPLIAGPDMIPGNADDPQPSDPQYVPPSLRFMALTRSQNQPGPDGQMGTIDDVIDTSNGDSSWVDQSQTYTSHPSHQVFLRAYQSSVLGPITTGKLIVGSQAGDGMATWADVKAQSEDLLGIRLVDNDIHNIPLLLTDPYGRFLRGDNGFPQLVVQVPDGPDADTAPDIQYLEGNPAANGNTGIPTSGPGYTSVGTNLPFLNDIAHHAVPGMSDCHGFGGPNTVKTADSLAGTADDNDCRTYDDEMLDAHFLAGDPRVNENIALTAVHQIFHSEHNRLVDRIAQQIASEIDDQDEAAWHDTSTHWLKTYKYRGRDADCTATPVCITLEPGYRTARDGIFEERIFQAARFVTEMEYQHLVFEEFGRKMQPGINPFNVFTQSAIDIDPAITAEFAHAVYRLGHSMLTDTVARTALDGTTYDEPLLDVFLNPPSYLSNDYDHADAPELTPEEAAGEIIMGLTDQVGMELDEFIVDTLRNNLLGLPLDLAVLNLTRARDSSVPPLNVLRAQLAPLDSSLLPYVSWRDFGAQIKHPESLANFIAAYGTHPSVTGATTLNDKRAAGQALVTGDDPFLDEAAATSGLDTVDLWIGGLAEKTNIGGGLLGTTFNYIFEHQLTDLQDGDRLYYLSRTSGMNLRTQLEGNSFAELIMRNTNARGLKADLFATADCQFSMAWAQSHITGSSIADDPSTTDCNENERLTFIGGAITYRTTNLADPAGLNAQASYNGTSGVDKMHGGVDTDTFWGGAGGDIVEGDDGADFFQTGDGDDLITDIHGPDFVRSGDGNDSVDTGPDDDVIMTGFGSDFANGGQNSDQFFMGEGNDFVLGGDGPDTVFGSGGDDWLEGGNANDLLQGDSGAPFFDDINCSYDESLPVKRCIGGHDVFIGNNGENDYDAEGGDDIMFNNASIERNAGLTGFDWVTHKGSSINGYSDLTIHVNFAPGALADRFLMTEAASGWDRKDELLGDQWTTLEQDVELHGPWGSNALTTAGINRIAGLRALLAQHDRIGEDLNHLTATTADDCYTDPQIFGDEGEGGPPQLVAQTICGYVKGATDPAPGTPPAGGNILIGGGEDDTIRGRGADDVIDGNLWLDVQLRATNDSNQTVIVDNLSAIQARIMLPEGNPLRINPGNITILRTLKSGSEGPLGDMALYGGAYEDYDFWTDGAGVLRVSHVRNVPPPTDQALPGGDGTDTLTNIERLKFDNGTLPDQIVTVASLPAATVSPLAQNFPNRLVGSASSQSVTVTNTGGGLPLIVSGSALAGAGAAAYTTTNNCTTVTVGNSCTFNVTFTPTAIGAFPATLTINTNGGSKIVTLTGNGVTAPSAPGTPTAVAGNGSATVTWAAPASDGGAAITGYSVQVTNNAGTQIGALRPAASSPFVVTGLTNGTVYRFRVQATNAVPLTGPLSALSNAVTPVGAAVDNVRPSVIVGSRVPANNASGAAVNKAANITATFSESVTGVSGVTAKLYRLSGFLNTTATEWPSTVSSTATTVTIDPVTNLNNGTFVVVLSSGTAASPLIRDLSNNRLENNVAGNLAFLLTPNIYSWQFVTSNASPAAFAGFSAVTPARLVDTRGGSAPTEAASGPVTPGHPLTLNVAGQAGVPASGAAAVSLNVTVTNPAAAGWVKVYGCGDMPATSNVNFKAGQTVANAVLTPVAANGDICIASHVATDVVVDINGFFSGGAGMTPVSPARLLDTRANGARVSAGAPMKLAVAGHGGVAQGASAVSLNVTVVDPSHAGWVKVHPCGTAQTTSNVNFSGNQIVANAVVTALGADGSVCITSQVDTDVVVDVNGYFTSDTGQTPFVPSRLVDTRPGESPDAAVNGGKVKVTPGSPLRIVVGGVAGVPAEDLGAVALNVTATNPVAAGWLNVYGCGAMPFASNVNFVAGQTVANSVLSPVDVDGAICISSNVSTDVVVDINGYFDK
ncbi:MAG: peroxidase family protein [Ilumatobacteraceae bacterium]